MQLTRHFTLDELTVSATAVQRGLDNRPATAQHMANLHRMADFLELVRALFGRPMTIISCYRSPAVNRAVGGVPTSDHANGLAADFRVQDVPGHEVASRIVASDLRFDQVIFYRPTGVVHVGIGHRMRRQALTNPTTKASHRPLIEGIVP